MLAFLDLKADFWLVLTLIILSFIASGTQDIATDAMTALSFNRKERAGATACKVWGILPDHF
jgi:hypothetical protein